VMVRKVQPGCVEAGGWNEEGRSDPGEDGGRRDSEFIWKVRSRRKWDAGAIW
jgi:hypothetical protein